jgi:hypothetical protein
MYHVADTPLRHARRHMPQSASPQPARCGDRADTWGDPQAGVDSGLGGRLSFPEHLHLVLDRVDHLAEPHRPSGWASVGIQRVHARLLVVARGPRPSSRSRPWGRPLHRVPSGTGSAAGHNRRSLRATAWLRQVGRVWMRSVDGDPESRPLPRPKRGCPRSADAVTVFAALGSTIGNPSSDHVDQHVNEPRDADGQAEYDRPASEQSDGVDSDHTRRPRPVYHGDHRGPLPLAASWYVHLPPSLDRGRATCETFPPSARLAWTTASRSPAREPMILSWSWVNSPPPPRDE